jgi:hypothetical protein
MFTISAHLWHLLTALCICFAHFCLLALCLHLLPGFCHLRSLSIRRALISPIIAALRLSAASVSPTSLRHNM